VKPKGAAAGSIEGRQNNPSDSDAGAIDAAWIGPGRALEATERDGDENENSDPGADDTVVAHVHGLLLLCEHRSVMAGDLASKCEMMLFARTNNRREKLCDGGGFPPQARLRTRKI
jgi:hypothetical protein